MNWWNTDWWSKEVERSDLWQTPVICVHCGWKNQPEDSLKKINVFFMRKNCPRCFERLKLFRIKVCSNCGKTFSTIRIPKNFQQFKWSGYSCNKCGSEFDKWGRKISL
jgi:DNA-directed RNA polymerase subunit RPC12/RpoP